ncbi:MAG: glutamine synthetase type III, partial [Lachnospiraceae bacterium]|nr:glutamine synthetase type III [Lachnospiraceae bacterium]
ANVAVDHNQLVMELMRRVAKKHGLVCLLHEKPFDGINGSGKHNNWSISTNTGINLLEPGKSPAENTQFLVFLAAVIKAVDEYADLLRMSVATPGNDHRLGANEAPPAVVSMFLGDELTAVVDSIEKGKFFKKGGKVQMEMGATVLPHFFKDNTDRNRTSPFAFTGNKFEFRMLGSSISVAGPNVILNTAVAESLDSFYEALKDVPEKKLLEEVHELVKKTLIAHKRIIFNGDGYTDAWLEEAKKRGLYNFKTTVDSLPSFIEKKNVKLFTKHGIFTETEIKSRYEILLENYVKTLHIEAKTLADMLSHDFLPGISGYTKDLAETIIAKKQAASGIACKAETKALKEISTSYDKLYDLYEKLIKDTAKAEATEDVLKAAKVYKDTVIKDMDDIRAVADALEEIVPEDAIPYPSYGKMLFYI